MLAGKTSWIPVAAFTLSFFSFATATQAQTTGALLGSPQLAPLGLESAWSTFMRVDPARGRVASVQVTHDLLLVQTNQGTLQVIHPESGRTLWTTTVGSPNYETMPPAANDKFVAITNGSTLYVYARSSGALLWQKRCGGSPSAGCAMGPDRVWVPLDSGIVEAYLLERGEDRELVDGIPKRFAGNGGAIAAPAVVGKRCSWSVLDGYVYSTEDTFKDRVQFRFRVDDQINTPPVTISSRLHVVSRRGTVYALDGVLGNEVWRFSLGDSVSHPPIALDGALYVIGEQGNMVRLDPALARQSWFGRGVGRFLAGSTDRLYLLDEAGRLSVRDTATGNVLGATPTRGFDLPCYNVDTDRIYLASSTGLLQCVRETKQATPLKHSATPAAAVAATGPDGAPLAPQPGAEPAPGADAAPAAPAVANPFGTP